MIFNPALHHTFVLVFEIKNASPASLSSLTDPNELARDVRYGLILEEALKHALNLYLERNLALPILKSWSAPGLNCRLEGKNGLMSYFNLRMFGLTNSTGHILIPGPVRFSVARSIDPILPLSSGRNAAYGLYRMHGYYNPQAGTENGVNDWDLELLWRGLSNFISGASRWPVASAVRGLWIFSNEACVHTTYLAKEVYRLIQIPALKCQARKFDDYTIQYPSPGHLEALPGVYLTRLV